MPKPLKPYIIYCMRGRAERSYNETYTINES